MTDAFILDCVRTPMGKGKSDGQLASVRGDELLALDPNTLRALRTRGVIV